MNKGIIALLIVAGIGFVIWKYTKPANAAPIPVPITGFQVGDKVARYGDPAYGVVQITSIDNNYYYVSVISFGYMYMSYGTSAIAVGDESNWSLV